MIRLVVAVDSAKRRRSDRAFAISARAGAHCSSIVIRNTTVRIPRDPGQRSALMADSIPR
jgi:hypothetical protein